MIGNYSTQIIYSGDSLVYINNVSDFIFNILYANYIYVDSVLRCDSLAKAFAGNTNSTAYYSKLWELSKGFTIKLFKDASYKLTCLIYTAWLNAGSPVSVEDDNSIQIVSGFELAQNYPNPFNPSTSIQYAISNRQFVSLKVYDVIGNEVATLVNEEKPAGSYELHFDANGLSSGVYFYTINAGSFIETKKMILLR
ncbi:MAG: T9SS type A sorting domain-containing protein [Ignavibacteriales bacterium]|nr:T9SS type A sorting domain-containing protein [Ignavibacteriales bacterium]